MYFLIQEHFQTAHQYQLSNILDNENAMKMLITKNLFVRKIGPLQCGQFYIIN